VPYSSQQGIGIWEPKRGTLMNHAGSSESADTLSSGLANGNLLIVAWCITRCEARATRSKRRHL